MITRAVADQHARCRDVAGYQASRGPLLTEDHECRDDRTVEVPDSMPTRSWALPFQSLPGRGASASAAFEDHTLTGRDVPQFEQVSPFKGALIEQRRDGFQIFTVASVHPAYLRVAGLRCSRPRSPALWNPEPRVRGRRRPDRRQGTCPQNAQREIALLVLRVTAQPRTRSSRAAAFKTGNGLPVGDVDGPTCGAVRPRERAVRARLPRRSVEG